MRTARRDRNDRLLAAIGALARSLEDLLVHLRTTDGLLRSRAGRLGPTLLGAIESAADAVHGHDHRRVAAMRLPAAGRGRELEGEVAHLRELVSEVDRAALRLRRSNRLPASVASPNADAAGVRSLLGDALEQRLDDLVPAELRVFLAQAGVTGAS